MAMIGDDDRKVITDYFAQNLKDPVKLVMFTQKQSVLTVPAGHTCQYCTETEQMVREVSELSDKVSVQVHDLVADASEAQKYGVDKIPAISVQGEKDYGVRYYGIPAGYEFTSLIEDIAEVSKGDTALTDETKQRLKEIDKDVHIQVFLTPT